ncbi:MULTISPECIES: outer membrane protein [unclassified Ruegeria]|uniref:outer membrane protein n=1 Tax=unclassified Ruegeria TaxID=2625375 RepID=UPI001489DFFA|nr:MULTISPECIES: porin family protein [unclassified Ruegeria]NOC93554.1 outer membrane beta-barrel protein [Ruegeria sp. HKCCD6604]
MTLKLALITTVATVVAGSAMAQSSGNWTGFYGGLQLGYADVDTSLSGVDGDGVIGGIILGYDYDLGDWVVGGGFDYDWTDVGLSGAATVEDVWRLKARAGYKVNPQGLLYGTAGYAEAGTDTLGSDDGWFIGAGYEQIVAPNVSIGGELLYHEFNNFNGSNVDVDATTLQVRVSYRF